MTKMSLRTSIAPHGAADEKKAGDFAIGDTVTYQLTSKVPDMTGYNSYTFKFTDTLSKGLDLKAILSVKVEIQNSKQVKQEITHTYRHIRQMTMEHIH